MKVEYPRARPEDIPGLQLAWIHLVAHVESCELVHDQQVAMTPEELVRCRRNTLVVDEVLYPGILDMVSLTMHPTVVDLARDGSRLAADGLDALVGRTGDPELAEVAAFLRRKQRLFAEAGARQQRLAPEHRAHVAALPTDATRAAMHANLELGWAIHPDVLGPLLDRITAMLATLDRYLDQDERP